MLVCIETQGIDPKLTFRHIYIRNLFWAAVAFINVSVNTKSAGLIIVKSFPIFSQILLNFWMIRE